MSIVPAAVQTLLQTFNQSHILRFWDQISDSGKERLLSEINATDFQQLRDIWKLQRHTSSGQQAVTDKDTATNTDKDIATERILRARAPRAVIRQPSCADSRHLWEAAAALGEQALHSGRTAIVTVAGGQGTRLGFDHPKGLFPIGPVTERTLFQIFAEQIAARQRKHNARLLWMIMTSDATHFETVAFFEQNRCFGLPEDSIVFFRQGCLPALDAETGRILMSGHDGLALSPDGHGGLIMALKNAGLLDRMEREGIEHVFYHQVDNPTVILADPALIGFHIQNRSELTTNVVCKTSPTERMGVLVDLDGHTEIIEYSELTPEQAALHDEHEQWIFWAGNTAIHVFDRSFLQRLAEDGCRLPLHVARKNVAYLNESGTLIQPTDASCPNAIKLERFIFDALPMASKTLIVEGNREREFNPVKNKTGADSAETSRAALNRVGQEWLRQAGHNLPRHAVVEISPLQALDADDLKRKLADGSLSIHDLQIKIS